MAEAQRQQQLDLQARGFDQQNRRDQTEWDQRRRLVDAQGQNAWDEQIAAGIRSGKLRYTPQQQQHIAKWQEAIFAVQNNSTLSDEEKATAIRELQAKIRRVMPVSVPVDQQPVPLQDDFRQKVFEHNGGLYTKDQHGVWQRIRGDDTGKPKTPEKPDKSDLSDPSICEAYKKAWDRSAREVQ